MMIVVGQSFNEVAAASEWSSKLTKTDRERDRQEQEKNENVDLRGVHSYKLE